MRIDSRCELTHSHPQWAAKCFVAYKNRVLKDGLEDEVHYVDRMVDDLLGDTDDPSQFESSSIEDGDPHKWKTASRDSLTSFVSAVTVDSILASSEIKNGENEDNIDNKERRGIESYIRMLDKVAKKSKDLREGSISESISTSSSDCYSGQFDSCAPDDASYSGSKDDTTIGTGQVFRTRVPYRRDTFVALHSNDEVEADDQALGGFVGSQRRIKSFHGATSLSRRQDNSFTHASEVQNYSIESSGDVPYAVQANRSIDHSGVFLDTFAKINLKASYDDGELNTQKKNPFKVAATPTSKELLGKPSCVVSKGAVNSAPKKSSSSDESSVNIAFSDIYRDDSSTGSVPVQKSNGSAGFPAKSEFDDESTIASGSLEIDDDGTIDNSSTADINKTISEKKHKVSNETASKSFNSADKENNRGVQNKLPAPHLLQPPYAKFAVSPTKQTKSTTETRLERTKSFRQEVEKTIAAKEVTLFNLRMELDAKNKYFSATMRSADNTTKFIEQIIQQVNARDSEAALTELLLTDSADYSAFKVSDESVEAIDKLESQLLALETALQRETRTTLNASATGKSKNKSELLKALAATLRQRIASQKELLKMARYYKSVLQEKNKLLIDITSKCKSLGNQVLATSKLPPPKEVIA